MKKLKTLILWSVVWGLPLMVHSAATIEFYSDKGLFTGVPDESWPVEIFTDAPAGTFDLNYTGFTDTPEGLKCGRIFMNAGITRFWQYAFVTDHVAKTPLSHDLSEYANGSIRFQMKANKPMRLTVRLVGVLGGIVRNFDIVVNNVPTVWTEYVFPLSAFKNGTSSIDLTSVRSPFTIVGPGFNPGGPTVEWSVDHIRWTKPVASLNIRPNSGSVQANSHRQFTVEGLSGSNEPVVVYASWSVTGVSPYTIAQSSAIQVGAVDGSITAKLVNSLGALNPLERENITTTANYNIDIGLDTDFGLLSETAAPGITLGGPTQDSFFSIYSESNTDPTLPVVTDDVSTFQEGSMSVKTVFVAKSNVTDYQGWALQWGLAGSPDTFVKNMSLFYDGSLRFWFKAPSNPSWNDNLKVGIRSGNVPAGKELSTVLLKDVSGFVFDNQWHSVVIPMSQLARSSPWADLSRTKIFFNIASTGTLSGTDAQRTFYIDNLRWDTRTPGSLVSIAVNPSAITLPVNVTRAFTATGLDANGVTVDINPTWDMIPAGGCGTLSTSVGAATVLTARSTAGGCTLRAQAAGQTGTSAVTINNIPATQVFNIYSDAGAVGPIGISTGPATPTLTEMGLKEPLGGVASDPTRFMRSTYTLQNDTIARPAFAVWFVEEGNGTGFLRAYSNGYIHFYVRTGHDLQVGIRSANINPGEELSKIKLSELGVLLNNSWQDVYISLDDLKVREPRLDFDQIKTYFTIGALATQIGEFLTPQTFDVDNVSWITLSQSAPDAAKVYAGLKEKQNLTTGLVRSYETQNNAYLYDQALAALNYTYRRDTALAKKIFDVYKNNFTASNGYPENINLNSPLAIIDGTRATGPNAWMLLAIIHYRNVTGDTTYDGVADGLAGWIHSLQTADGGVQYGIAGATTRTEKSTEHNFDIYAAFNAYARIKSAPVSTNYSGYANQVLIWLRTVAYNNAQKRFNVGTQTNGAINPDKALDAYSWAPLALSSYTHLLGLAETEFRNTKTCLLTGVPIDGFDFSGPFSLSGGTPDKDAVWLEGTGEMALAYYAIENKDAGDFFVREMEKSIVDISPTGQGLPYATNAGTAYGFNMNATNPAISSMAWYLFAKNKFNPFKPFPINSVAIKNRSNRLPATVLSFGSSLPADWVMSNQYLQLDAQSVTTDAWGIQMYTDNKNPTAVPRFVDPTIDVTTNLDSDPSGLLMVVPSQPTTSIKLPLAWVIQDTTGTLQVPPPVVSDPTNGLPDSFQWFFVQDAATPAIDLDGDGSSTGPTDGLPFANGADYIRVKKTGGVTGTQIHAFQGSYLPSLFTDYLYFETNFAGAATQANYSTQIVMEFFYE